ncbi:MAG: hypothetical protein AB4042_09775 [Leptolyngbyaceae cyanobacterium]
MKFLPFLVLPCFLTLGATPFTSGLTASSSAVSESTESSITINASDAANGTARRGSGRETGRRQVLAHAIVAQATL